MGCLARSEQPPPPPRPLVPRPPAYQRRLLTVPTTTTRLHSINVQRWAALTLTAIPAAETHVAKVAPASLPPSARPLAGPSAVTRASAAMSILLLLIPA